MFIEFLKDMREAWREFLGFNGYGYFNKKTAASKTVEREVPMQVGLFPEMKGFKRE